MNLEHLVPKNKKVLKNNGDISKGLGSLKVSQKKKKKQNLGPLKTKTYNDSKGLYLTDYTKNS